MKTERKRFSHKLLSVVLTAVLLFGMVGSFGLGSSMIVFAASDVWDGTTDTSWYDGGDSYEITTAAQLAGLTQLVAAGTDFNGVTFTLMNDIDLNEIEWEPIGTNHAFEGVIFDGNGHVVDNMKITAGNWYEGLFGWVKKSLIKNLGVTNAEIVSDGAEVGILTGGIYESSIFQCYTTGTITISNGIGDAVGGLVGQYYCDSSDVSDYIRQCYSSVDIISDSPGQFGGLVGWVSTYNDSTFTIADSYYAGTMSIADGDSASNGIAGIAMSIIGFGFPNLPKGNYVIENCYVSGIVENTEDSTSALGIALIDGTVDNCYWNSESEIEGVMQMEWDKDNGDFLPGDDSLTTNTEEKSLDDMKSSSFVDTLNNGREPSVWGTLKNSTEYPYPMLMWQLKAFPADYSAVDTAISNIPVDLSIYTDNSVNDLNTAKNAVVRGKMADEQTTVDGYATAIENAIAALVYKDANYSAVDAAIASIPADLNIYTDDSVAALNAAKDAVVRSKNITEQTTVDGYATAIENAIAALVYKGADYSAVTAAKAKIPSDLSIYTDESVAALNAAVSAVVEGLDITKQDIVDGYAKAIEDAVNGLVLKTLNPSNPDTGDTFPIVALLGMTMALGVFIITLKKRRTNV